MRNSASVPVFLLLCCVCSEQIHGRFAWLLPFLLDADLQKSTLQKTTQSQKDGCLLSAVTLKSHSVCHRPGLPCQPKLQREGTNPHQMCACRSAPLIPLCNLNCLYADRPNQISKFDTADALLRAPDRIHLDALVVHSLSSCQLCSPAPQEGNADSEHHRATPPSVLGRRRPEKDPHNWGASSRRAEGATLLHPQLLPLPSQGDWGATMPLCRHRKRHRKRHRRADTSISRWRGTGRRCEHRRHWGMRQS